MVFEQEETKETTKKGTKKTIRFCWIIAAMIAIAAIALTVAFVSMITNNKATIEDQEGRIESFIAKQVKWEQTKEKLAETTEQNVELEEANESLKLEIEKARKEKSSALAKAAIARDYGEDMEELARSHAQKFQELRIKNNKLSAELVQTRNSLKSYKDLAQKMRNQKNIYLKMLMLKQK